MDKFESLMETLSYDPYAATQRECERFQNIAEVNVGEAINIGLAQCCGYARFMKSLHLAQGNAEFIDSLGQLTQLMAASCGVNISTKQVKS